MGTAMLTAAATIAALMLTTWVTSLVLRNASIVDIVWGLGFVLVAWAVRLTVDGNGTRQIVELKSTYCDRCDRSGPGPSDAAWGADGVADG